MARDKITKVKDVGFLGSLKESIKRVFGGIGLIFIAPLMLFWNECRSVQTAQSLEEGAGAVISAEASAVDAKLEGALVHITGESASTHTLTDTDFQVKSAGLKLRREVEMYQWIEKEETRKEDDKEYTTWTYNKGWSGEVQNSSRFEEPDGHTNPGSMPYEGQTWTAPQATLGAYTLSEAVIEKINNYTEIDITDEQAAVVGAKAHQGDIYLGSTPSSPTIGDVRISFEAVPTGPTSVIGQQVGETFAAYQTQAGDKLLLVRTEAMTAEAMFEAAQDANVVMTWVLRLVGFMMIFAGFGMLLGPFKVVADKVPVIGGVIEKGIGAISFLLAVVIAFITISVAWIAARPLLGISLLVVGLGGIAGIVFLIIKAKKSAPAPEPEAA